MTWKKKTITDAALVAGIIFWTALMGCLYLWNVANEKEQTNKLSKYQARAFFQEIVTTRSWNAMHGGVYVPVTDRSQPNPYLEDPQRDAVTMDGLQLTKINPAYMTRQISEIANQKNLIRFHITSDRPIRPANAPDSWESNALELFREGEKEFSEFIEGKDGEKTFRYMAPLWVEPSCLKCHAAQGYKEGELRGGISVAISANPIFSHQQNAVRQMGMAYGGIWAFGLLCAFIGYRLLKREEERRLKVILKLEESIRDVKKLSGLLPICSICKKIRDDKGYWTQIESYIREHSDADFSHSLCEECTNKYYSDFKNDKD